MKKVGIMGGTFNPVHMSHLLIASGAFEAFKLDKILFMPSKLPPHKPNTELASEEDRCAMIKLAIKDYPYFEFSDFELNREGYTYTSETLKRLTEMNPDTRYYFIVGGDSLKYFDTWHNPEEILDRCALICAPRVCESNDGNAENYNYREIAEKLRNKFTKKLENGKNFVPEIYMLPSVMVSISSSLIRNYFKCGREVSGMVPVAVSNYISEKKLYKSEFFENIKSQQKEKLSQKRYDHVMRVAELAFRLAQNHGVDPVRAYTAGLLHDCAKYLKDEEILREADSLGIVYDEVEKNNASNLLHSKVGAVWAKTKYGIEDEEILSAITYHTTGKPGMTKLELIINLADILEPGRVMDYNPSLDAIRSEATYDLELACFHVLDNMVPYILEHFKENVCTTTIDTYEYYKKLIEARE